MYKLYRVFILEIHPYRRITFAFNGKPKRTQTPRIMTSYDQLRAYDSEKEKEIAKMFDSNGEPIFDSNEEPMFDVFKLFDTYDEKIPK